MAGEVFWFLLLGWTRLVCSLRVLSRLLVLQIDILVILEFWVIVLHLVLKLLALSLVILGNLRAVPINIAVFLTVTKVPQFEDVLLSITTGQQCVSIILEINSITADVWTVEAHDRALSSDIVKMNRVVPATGCNYIWIIAIPAYAKDSIGVSAVKPVFFHLEHDTLRVLIIYANILVLACRSE